MNYRISWPLGQAIAHLPKLWTRRGLSTGDQPQFRRCDMWLISSIWAFCVGSALATFVSAIASTAGDNDHIVVWHNGPWLGFWAYLIGAFPLLFCMAMEAIVATGVFARMLLTLAKMSVPRIERIPVDRELVNRYERGEL